MLKNLKTQHRTMIQMSFNGYSNIEIAERLETTTQTVSAVLNSALGKSYLEGMQDRAKENTLDIRKKLVSLNKDALKTFERILDPKQKAPFSVQFSTARDILDRNGYKAPDKLNIDMALQAKTDNELDAEIAALEESINRNQGISKDDIKALPGVATTINLHKKKQEDIYHYEKPEEEEPTEEAIQLNLDAVEHSLDDPSVLDDPNFDPFHNLEANS